MEIIADHPIIDAVLARHAEALGSDAPVYGGHVYRMVNIARWRAEAAGVLDEEAQGKLAVAAAFHDIGIWAAGTFDYLAPSRRLAEAWLAETGRTAWAPEVAAMIDEHHKIRPHSRDPADLVEIFRRADLADLSLGLIRSGTPRALLRDLTARFPNAGFQRRLVALTAAWWPRHPLDPLPMFKW